MNKKKPFLHSFIKMFYAFVRIRFLIVLCAVVFIRHSMCIGPSASGLWCESIYCIIAMKWWKLHSFCIWKKRKTISQKNILKVEKSIKSHRLIIQTDTIFSIMCRKIMPNTINDHLRYSLYVRQSFNGFSNKSLLLREQISRPFWINILDSISVKRELLKNITVIKKEIV